MKIAICDDNLEELNTINSFIQKYKQEISCTDIQLCKYNSATSLLAAVNNKSTSSPDIFILDVVMPDITGIELAKTLRQNNHSASIIFATHSKEFALDAFSVDAMQYLIKPITYESLLSVLNKAIAISNIENSSSISVNSKDGFIQIYFHNILFAECAGHCVHFHLTDGNVVKSKTLREGFSNTISPLLTDNRFLRPHQSYVINMSYVSKMLNKDFEMNNGRLIPLAKDKSASIKELYAKYLYKRSEV